MKYKAYDQYTPEELEALGKKLEAEREERIKLNLRCNEIRELFENDGLPELSAHWQTDKKDIDFSKQPHQLEPELMREGYSIEFVGLEALLDSMQPGNPALYRENQMFHDDWSDTNICRVIDAWLNEQKLIPPTVVLNEDLNQTFLADGKHRFNVAYCLGEQKIPVIIPNIHLERVLRLIQS